ncbi:MAG: helix-turn-helix domain-containing protein [Bacteroidota bacterium]
MSFIQYLFGYWDAGELTFSIVTVCLVVLLFWIGYFLVLHYNWFEIAPLKKQNLTEDSQSGKLSSNTVHYYNRLKQLLQEEKIYEDVNLTLDNLSEQLQISSGYLSQIIKEKEQKNFFEFINAYRVESVKAKLLNTDYSNYTIMGIALESGFNSKSTFNSVFKKFTNETPSAFKRKNVLGQ